MAARFDVVVRGGILVDGTGNPARPGDIGVRGERIEAIGNLADFQASRVIDATGLHVTPGFINMHSHLDFSVLANPTMDASVHQGITFELGGQCGASVAPTDAAQPALIKDYYRYFWHGLALDWDWVRVDDFFERLDAERLSVNFGMMVGHTNLRLLTIGNACRPATENEVVRLKNELKMAMADGAFGLSTGLQWAPGFFSETRELIELCSVLRDHGGVYASHMRSEGDRLLEAVQEVIDIGEAAGIPAIVSHLKASGRSNFGKVHGALRMIADARRRGVDVFADTQPYGGVGHDLAAEHMMLRSCLPPWIIAETGGGQALRAQLLDPAFRRRLKEDLVEKRSPEWNTRVVDCILDAVGWENLVLGKTDGGKYRKFEGRSIADMSRQLGKEPFELYFDMLAEEDVPSGALFFMMDPDDVKAVVTSPFAVLEVDGSPRSCHPRLYGCFPRYLDEYAGPGGQLSLEDAIRKITSLPASILGLEDRGLLRVGNYADIVLINLKELKDRSSFEDSEQYPSGIPHVIVNGVQVITDGVHTGARPGKVVRKRSSAAK